MCFLVSKIVLFLFATKRVKCGHLLTTMNLCIYKSSFIFLLYVFAFSFTLFLFIIFSIIFLLFIWNFHIMHPTHTHFPVLPGPTHTQMSPIWVACIVMGHGQTPSGQPLKENVHFVLILIELTLRLELTFYLGQ